MERRLFLIASIAFVLELCLYLGDLGVIPIPFLSDSATTKQLPVIGEVEVARREVRRRSFESTIWEDSASNEVLFERDSLLTLAGSSAKLKLKGETHIELRENTLVVLEPLEGEDSAPFRLRFSRGDVRARTSLSGVIVQSGEWLLTAAQGTELNLRTIDSDRVEVDVSKGQVELMHKDQSSKITLEENQRLTLRPEEAGPVLSASPELRWVGDFSTRYYSHNFPLPISLSWDGEATLLEISSPGEGAKEIKLAGSQRRILVPLPFGSFSLTLKGPSGISKPMPIEVLPAPKFIYLTPLPRDRAKTGDEVVFTWLSESTLPKYRLEFSAQENFNTKIHVVDVPSTRAQTPLPGPGDLFWRVIGFDEDGFIIPANHSYPIYSLPDPLAPPRLRAPTSKEEDTEAKLGPQRRPTRWWLELLDVLLPQAHGQAGAPGALPPVIFNWDSLPGADFYIIEISDEPSFRDPLIVAKTSTNYYAWSRFVKGIYYYRVAGGSSSGRKGAFSQPEKVDLTIWPLPKAKKVAKDLAKAPTPPPPQPLPVPAIPSPPPPAAQEKAPSVEFVGPIKPSIAKARLWWRGLWQYLNLEGKDRTSASFSGFTHLSLGADWSGDLYQLPVVVRASFARTVWTPKLTSQLPFQADLNMDRLRMAAGWRDRTSPWQIGMSLGQAPLIERKTLESLKTTSQLTFGAWVAWEKSIENDLWLGELRTETASQLTEVTIHGQWARPWTADWFFGAEAELRASFGSNRGFMIQSGIHLGKSW